MFVQPFLKTSANTFLGLRSPVLSSLFPVFSLVSRSFCSNCILSSFIYFYFVQRTDYFLLATTSPVIWIAMTSNSLPPTLITQFFVFCHKSCFSRPLIFFVCSSPVDCLPQSRPRNAAEAFPVISRKQHVLQTSTFHIPREYLFLSKHCDTVNSFKVMSQYECQCFLKNLLICVSFSGQFSCGILS